MHAAVLMIPVPSAVKVPPVRVSMHVAMMMVISPGIVDLAVLVIAMPSAIQVPSMWVAVHVAMMMAVPVVPIDVDFLGLVHNCILNRAERPQRCCLGGNRCERQDKPSTRQR